MSRIQKILVVALVVVPVLAQLACSDDKADGSSAAVKVVTSVEHFNTILESAGSRLIAFDLYADWCMPCHVLNPTLAEIAREEGERVSIYQIDTDQFPQITEAFGATGIPFVVFVKNQRAVYALLGVQPKDTYLQVIENYSDTAQDNFDVVPNGQGVEGLRVKNAVPFEKQELRFATPPGFAPAKPHARAPDENRRTTQSSRFTESYFDIDSPVILPCQTEPSCAEIAVWAYMGGHPGMAVEGDGSDWVNPHLVLSSPELWRPRAAGSVG